MTETLIQNNTVSDSEKPKERLMNSTKAKILKVSSIIWAPLATAVIMKENPDSVHALSTVTAMAVGAVVSYREMTRAQKERRADFWKHEVESILPASKFDDDNVHLPPHITKSF